MCVFVDEQKLAGTFVESRPVVPLISVTRFFARNDGPKNWVDELAYQHGILSNSYLRGVRISWASHYSCFLVSESWAHSFYPINSTCFAILWAFKTESKTSTSIGLQDRFMICAILPLCRKSSRNMRIILQNKFPR